MTKKSHKIVYFLLIKDAKYILVPEEILDSLSPQEAKALALTTKFSQRLQLLIDAKVGDHKLEGEKVVDKLEATLNKFYKLYPWLEQDIKVTENNVYKLNLPKA